MKIIAKVDIYEKDLVKPKLFVRKGKSVELLVKKDNQILCQNIQRSVQWSNINEFEPFELDGIWPLSAF